MALAVASALDARGLRPALVAGNSMGGYVALALAEARPELVPAVALVDSRARADLPEERERRLQQIAELEAAGPRAGERLSDWMLPRLLAAGASGRLRAEVHGWILEASGDGAAAALGGMAARPDRTEVLARFGGPVLLVAGAEDPITTPAEMEQLGAELAGRGAQARVLRVEGAGHLPQLERVDDVVGALRGVLGAT
jgi:pimeloyl-ACP methyl ester carboxylesterase